MPHSNVASLPRLPRHALGLPAGSVRALLALMVLGVLWLLAWKAQPDDPMPVTYVYLQFVMILILANFFAAHGSSIGTTVSERHPLGLPAGSVRFLLLAGYLGLVFWLLYTKPKFEAMEKVPMALVLVLVIAFFAGYLLNKAVKSFSGGAYPFWFQDVQAWLALLATIGLTITTIIQVFIRPSLSQDFAINPATLANLDLGIAAILGFYFGARS
jgi:Mn2+/Fe2+ NRAMP family transporter